jgi:isocitrate lyase
MSFQGYLNTIKTKTGKGPADFRAMAEEKGFTQNGELKAKAGDIVAWLKADFDLGHGHAMAIYALLKGMKNEDSE